MPPAGSPATLFASSPRWYGSIDNRQQPTVHEYTEEAGNPFKDIPSPTESCSSTCYQTPRADRFSPTLPTISLPGRQTSFSKKDAAALLEEDTARATQPPTVNLSPTEKMEKIEKMLHTDHPFDAEFLPLPPTPTIISQQTSDDRYFIPTRELPMPQRGCCVQLGLLLVALCPILIVPLFCTFALLGLWIPKSGGENALALLPQLTAPGVTMTLMSVPTETITLTVSPTSSALVESTSIVVDDPAISIYPDAVRPKGGLSP
ncbi:hypothetical protein HCBG_01184 [Histoplasma capsulatum G186AR]|uniref:Uncharacterized protein n=2 Tax=Ajellomyces capsulatus TaxID=5037 RepID=C0NA25_AJECG|nr:uncharacterized protein HCBG_01184 [Histoplasma capsulatum G186AR]EEH11729.1 hypothetical protein HCBG_01184 [Histoplasma capsulatum G186AR]KAG5302411.1 hypothetical protein I7I52_00045 [Histoplasma capsulatum]QSS72190.1 hypothetical protein I7I50_03286 [Histoplasma capsulatum G186AR]